MFNKTRTRPLPPVSEKGPRDGQLLYLKNYDLVTDTEGRMYVADSWNYHTALALLKHWSFYE
jgi:hypothetical protein